jgi:hypothetical protein
VKLACTLQDMSYKMSERGSRRRHHYIWIKRTSYLQIPIHSYPNIIPFVNECNFGEEYSRRMSERTFQNCRIENRSPASHWCICDTDAIRMFYILVNIHNCTIIIYVNGQEESSVIISIITTPGLVYQLFDHYIIGKRLPVIAVNSTGLFKLVRQPSSYTFRNHDRWYC